MLILKAAILVASVTCALGASSSAKKCEQQQSGLDDCAAMAFRNAINLIKVGKKDDLLTIEPLHIPEISIPRGAGAIKLYQHYKKIKLIGLSGLQCDSFQINLLPNVAKIACKLHQLRIEFRYSINGKILIFPLIGEGPGYLVLRDVEAKLAFQLEANKRNGKKYFKMQQTSLDLQPEIASIQLDNLFNGDQGLSDTLNEVINENWRDFFIDLKPIYEGVAAQEIERIANSLFSKISEEELLQYENI